MSLRACGCAALGRRLPIGAAALITEPHAAAQIRAIAGEGRRREANGEPDRQKRPIHLKDPSCRDDHDP